MWINHIHFYLEDAEQWRDWFVHKMGFSAIARHHDGVTLTEIVASNQVLFFLSSPLDSTSPIADYLRLHPPGVVDLAFLVQDLDQILETAINYQVNFAQPPQYSQSRRCCQIITPVKFKHTLIESNNKQPILPFDNLEYYNCTSCPGLFTHIDHLVLNVGMGKLGMMIKWYESVLGFQPEQKFEIGTDLSALASQVMVHPQTGIQLPINEPVDANSQIQEFLDYNRGAGIQHIALFTPKITVAVPKLQASGLKFLPIPEEYYRQLPDLNLSSQEYQTLKTQGILAEIQTSQDSDLKPLLLQIFTQPIFKIPTFFFELIERRYGACGFGAGNFQALFEAIEREQLKRKSE